VVTYGVLVENNQTIADIFTITIESMELRNNSDSHITLSWNSMKIEAGANITLNITFQGLDGRWNNDWYQFSMTLHSHNNNTNLRLEFEIKVFGLFIPALNPFYSAIILPMAAMIWGFKHRRKKEAG